MHELESAADHIADASRADLQVLLRRAALVLRNVGGINLDPRTDDALTSLAAGMRTAKPDLVDLSGEWLVANSYLPVPHAVDEERTVDGNG
ncbi:hypothetical protein [Mesorhizobium sp. M2A.F.Ca.ET.043.02.1.1]|uniref:hypothetical protein n=1 Tax=Mesorhizobium sp. M2A.F.Ca.ET.043.02.1.1 TaxID=2493670 RepID=UPI000F75AB5E|nr:hypothetical protein [Mesorhizobium sp. M2A.F.Ca.ET.043.02.1.1]AZO05605.1 hypothetical protein EJ068_22935 [Mesorhizobium sp. M2A.F.Ca.ET.043.02.1.1]